MADRTISEEELTYDRAVKLLVSMEATELEVLDLSGKPTTQPNYSSQPNHSKLSQPKQLQDLPVQNHSGNSNANFAN